MYSIRRFHYPGPVSRESSARVRDGTLPSRESECVPQQPGDHQDPHGVLEGQVTSPHQVRRGRGGGGSRMGWAGGWGGGGGGGGGGGDHRGAGERELWEGGGPMGRHNEEGEGNNV